MNIPKKHMHGFTLTELMVSLAIAGFLSVGVVATFSSQTRSFVNSANEIQATADVRDVYDILNRLLQQANSNSINIYANNAITNSEGTSAVRRNDGSTTLGNDEIIVDFTLPAGQIIWPNNSGANNFVRLAWANSGTDAFQIFISNGPSAAALQPRQLLAGSATTNNTRIINLDLWPLNSNGSPAGSNTSPAPGGYRLVVTGTMDPTNTGTTMVSSLQGAVIPRN